MSSRGEEGRHEYLMITSGSNNFMSQDAGWDYVSCLFLSQRAMGQPALPWGQQARALEGPAGKGPKGQVPGSQRPRPAGMS